MYRQVLQSQPRHTGAIHLLGVIAFQRGDPQRACTRIQQAIAIGPPQAAMFNNLGLALAARGQLNEATVAFEEAVALQPEYADAWSNLGMVRRRQGRLHDTQHCYDVALSHQPTHVDALYNSANLLHDLGRPAAAVERYRVALRLAPERAEIHNNLGRALLALHHAAEAISSFRTAMQRKPDYAEPHYNLGLALADQDENDTAAVSFRHAVRLRPANRLWQFRSEILWPPVFQSHAEIDVYWVRLEETLDRYIAAPLNVDWDEIVSCGCIPPFNLAHQGRDCLALKAKFARVFEPSFAAYNARQGTAALRPSGRVGDGGTAEGAGNGGKTTTASALRPLTPTLSPEYRGEGGIPFLTTTLVPNAPGHGAESRASSGRPRVGFVLTRGHEAVFLRCMAGIINRLPQDRFELAVFCAPSAVETVRHEIPDPRIVIHPLPPHFPWAVRALADAACDLLYYWEIGSDALNYFLPFLRLAPVQCTSWGTLVTSAVPQVDYYLSSALVETAEADRHYSERLVRLDGLLSCQPRIALPHPARSRNELGLPEDKHLYVCPQNLLKFHHDFDILLAEILRRDATGLVVLKHGPRPRAGAILLERFRRTIGDVVDRIVMLPWQDREDYLRLLAAADVVLDTVHYGAGSTAYDLFSLDLPVVTWPGPFNVGRYTTACYGKMGIDDLVASSAEQYVEIAVRLGTDAAYRHTLRRRIAAASVILFDDSSVVAAHERFFADAVRARVS